PHPNRIFPAPSVPTEGLRKMAGPTERLLPHLPAALRAPVRLLFRPDMRPMFPVYDVTRWAPERPEALGSKAKVWLLPTGDCGLPMVPHLFKVGRPGTGENWAEKAACELAKALD